MDKDLLNMLSLPKIFLTVVFFLSVPLVGHL